MTIFKLPDLGEGLAEAEIVEWLVKTGDHVQADQHLVSVETAKAVVDIPSPFQGVIKKLYAKPGEVVAVGKPLIEFESEISSQESSTTVAGKLEIGDTLTPETAHIAIKSSTIVIKASPAVRALAKQLGVDLASITGTGHQGNITREDILNATPSKDPQKSLQGTRRTMAKTMSRAYGEIVPVTIYDDVIISHWRGPINVILRTIRAIVKACEAEPVINAWFKNGDLTLNSDVNLGIAIDSEEGLFVPVLREANKLLATPEKIREKLEYFKKAVKSRKISVSEMQDPTFTLSNFGVFAGRYATTIVVPPQSATLAIGKIRKIAAPDGDEVKIQRILPLSLTFDHRAITGGEATRFLGILMKDLSLAE